MAPDVGAILRVPNRPDPLWHPLKITGQRFDVAMAGLPLLSVAKRPACVDTAEQTFYGGSNLPSPPAWTRINGLLEIDYRAQIGDNTVVQVISTLRRWMR